MPGLVRVHFLDVGQANCALVRLPREKPDALPQTMLVDCGYSGSEEKRLEHIKSYLYNHIESRDERGLPVIDYLVVTHPHDDHLNCFPTLIDDFAIGEVWDSGIRLAGDEAPDKGAPYHRYVRFLGAAGKSAKYPKASKEPFCNVNGCRIHCLAPFAEGALQTDPHKAGMVLKIEFAGRSVMFPGDSEVVTWRDGIVPEFDSDGLLDTTILLASHHGGRSFFKEAEDSEDVYTGHIELMTPVVTVIPCGDKDEYGHPHGDALDIYRQHTWSDGDVPSSQVYSLHDLGTLVLDLWDTGHFDLTPTDFSRRDSSRFSVRLVYEPVKDVYAKGDFIRFRAIRRSRTGDRRIPLQKLVWQVRNSGEAADEKHKEIYSKQYEGRGLSCPFPEVAKRPRDWPCNRAKCPEDEWCRECRYTGEHFMRHSLVDPEIGDAATDFVRVVVE